MEAEGDGSGGGRPPWPGPGPAPPSLSPELRGTKAWRARGIGSGSVEVDAAESPRPADGGRMSSDSSYSGTTCSVAALSLWCCPKPSFTCDNCLPQLTAQRSTAAMRKSICKPSLTTLEHRSTLTDVWGSLMRLQASRQLPPC